jgi:hypothetical protein
LATLGLAVEQFALTWEAMLVPPRKDRGRGKRIADVETASEVEVVVAFSEEVTGKNATAGTAALAAIALHLDAPCRTSHDFENRLQRWRARLRTAGGVTHARRTP